MSDVTFDWPAVRQVCADAGARTNEECAELMGISLATLDRIRKNPDATTLRTALRIACFAQKSLDDVFLTALPRSRRRGTTKAAA